MANLRVDETWHRLLNWGYGQAPSERLSGLIAASAGWTVDPTHPLGGTDGGKDALLTRSGETWVMACYFPRGQQTIAQIKKKLVDDSAGVGKNHADGILFVTNQEITDGDRKTLESAVTTGRVELLHLEKLTHELDQPKNHGIRWQFLKIPVPSPPGGAPKPSDEDQESLDELFGVLSRVAVANTQYPDFESSWRDSIVDPWREAIHKFADGKEWEISNVVVEDARKNLLVAGLEFFRAESVAVDHRQSGFRWLGVSDTDASIDRSALERLQDRAAVIRAAAESAADAHEILIETARANGYSLAALRGA